MRYNVSQLLQEPVGSFRDHDLDGVLAEIDEHNPGPVPIKGQITLIRTPKGILSKGHASITLVEPCRRCLEQATLEAELDIEEEFIPSIDILTGAALPITEEDEPDLLINEHHVLDLAQILRQYALAEGIAGALCRPDCQGLCPVCGANKNVTACDCDTRTLDPRLSILAQMLERQEREQDEERNSNR